MKQLSKQPPAPSLPQQRHFDDTDAVRRFQHGDRDAFNELVEVHCVRLMRLIRQLVEPSEDPEDALQETLVAAYCGLHRFRCESSFRTWVTRIAINKCRSIRRRNSRKRLFVSAFASIRKSRVVEPSESDRNDVIEEVRRAVQMLTPIYREPIVLTYFEHLPVEQIAEVLQLKPNTVEVRLSRARGMLRESLIRRLECDQSP